MKKYIILLLGFFLTGCNIQSPDEVVQMPIYDEKKSDLYENISKLMLNTDYLLPKNSKEVSKINEVDLDNDEVVEIVVFEEKKISDEEESEVGFSILQNDKLIEDGQVLVLGDSIEYANFYDLDDDGIKEIIMLVNKNDEMIFYVFKFLDEVKEVYKLNLENVKIKIGYIDEDPTIDILMVHFNEDENLMYISVTNFSNEKLVLKDFIKIEDVRELSEIYISIENVNSSTKGAIIEFLMESENSYKTQIIFFEEDKLKKAFEDDDIRLKKSYYIPLDDINNDKVVEIPTVNKKSKSTSNVVWYKWNGKSGEDSDLIFVNEIYYNYNYNFKMVIDENLSGKILVQRDISSENIVYNFNYEDKTLFSIYVVQKILGDENKSINLKNSMTLLESEDNTFILHIEDEKISYETLSNNFSLIY
jgi:hypothetical protein